MAEQLSKVLFRKERTILNQLSARWSAFEKFCLSRINVRPEEVLKACGYSDESELKAMLNRHSDSQPDEKLQAEHLDTFQRAWDGRFGGVPSGGASGW